MSFYPPMVKKELAEYSNGIENEQRSLENRLHREGSIVDRYMRAG